MSRKPKNESTRQGFKKTSSGVIPMDWECAELGKVSDITMGQSPPSNVVEDEPGDLAFLQGNAEFGARYPQARLWCETPNRRATRGSILLSVRAPVGALNIADQDYGIGRGLAAILATDSDQNYLWYALHYRVSAFSRTAQGTTFTAINKKDLYSLPIPWPSLREQRRIAEVLQTVDDAIEKSRTVIEQTKRVKKALTQQLLTRGLPGKHKRFKQTPIGEIPDEWEVICLKEVGTIITGSTPMTSHIEHFNGEYPFVTPADLGTTRVISDTKRSVSESGMNASRPIPIGSVMVVCIGATVGKVAIAGTLCCTNQQINSIVCSERAVSEYIYHVLMFRRCALMAETAQTAVPIVNKNQFGSFAVPLPTLEEQRIIADSLSVLEDRIEDEWTRVRYVESLKQSLMTTLLTGKIWIKDLDTDVSDMEAGEAE